jgi:hypothetical protein
MRMTKLYRPVKLAIFDVQWKVCNQTERETLEQLEKFGGVLKDDEMTESTHLQD